jgi:hypothetical protein
MQHVSNCGAPSITLHFLVVERVSRQAVAAAHDLAALIRSGTPAQALHANVDPEETRTLRRSWAEATSDTAVPLVILPVERGSTPGEAVVAYVKGALSFDRRLRVNLITVSRRAQPLRRVIVARPTNGITRQLRNAFRDEQRVILSDYCQDDDS